MTGRDSAGSEARGRDHGLGNGAPPEAGKAKETMVPGASRRASPAHTLSSAHFPLWPPALPRVHLDCVKSPFAVNCDSGHWRHLHRLPQASSLVSTLDPHTPTPEPSVSPTPTPPPSPQSFPRARQPRAQLNPSGHIHPLPHPVGAQALRWLQGSAGASPPDCLLLLTCLRTLHQAPPDVFQKAWSS